MSGNLNGKESGKPVSPNKYTLQNIWKDEKQETGLVPRKGEENRQKTVLLQDTKKHNRHNIKNNKNSQWIQEKRKNSKKASDKVNREKTQEQLENIGIQGRIMEFIRKLISER